jgi:hypothetical protein
VPSHCE